MFLKPNLNHNHIYYNNNKRGGYTYRHNFNCLLVSTIIKIFNLVNPHNPVLGSEGLFQDVQLEVLVADLLVSDSVPAGRFPLLCHHLPKPGIRSVSKFVDFGQTWQQLKCCYKYTYAYSEVIRLNSCGSSPIMLESHFATFRNM